nr:hypothetical protein L203_06678 [Cryptococcus depauperatus CBS 7841]
MEKLRLKQKLEEENKQLREQMEVDDDNNGAGGHVDDITVNPQQLPTLYI